MMPPDDSNSEETPPGGSNQCLLPEVTVDSERCFKYRVTFEPLLLAIFFADSLADSITVNLALKRTCEIHFHYNKSVCSNLGNLSVNDRNIEAIVQPYTTVILTGMSFLSQLIPALLSLFLGPWSDYNGRKLIILIPSLGYFLKYMLLFVLCFFPKLGPEYLLAAVIPVALSGGMVNFISAAFAYVSDISKEENQSFRMTLVESVIHFGTLIGLLSTSELYKAGGIHGFKLIYGICALVVLFTAVPTHFLIRESTIVTERSKGLCQVFEVKLLKEMFQVCFKKREGCKRAVIFLVITSMTITISCGLGESNVLFLFTKLRFGWDVGEFTTWRFVVLTIGFLGLVCGSVLFMKWLKVPDALIVFMAYALRAASAFYIAFIPSDAPQMMFYSGLINSFEGLSSAIGRSLLSKSVSKKESGKVLALVGTAESMLSLAVAPLYTTLYNATLQVLPSAFELLSGSLFILCCIFYIIIYFITRKRDQTEYRRMENENNNEDQNEIGYENESRVIGDSN